MPPSARPVTIVWMSFDQSISRGMTSSTRSSSRSSSLCALHHHAPDLEHVRALRGGKRDARVLLDHEHREPHLVRERGDELVEVAHDRRREPERRLVEQQQLRPRDERPSEGEHLLLTAGQGSRLLVPPALESREVAGDVLAVALRLAPVAAVIRADEEVLPDGQLGVDLPALGDVGDAEPRDRLGGLAADRPCRRRRCGPTAGRCPRSRAASTSCRRRSLRGWRPTRRRPPSARRRAAPGRRRSGRRRCPAPAAAPSTRPRPRCRDTPR